jgi:hypothetical protein
MPVYIHIHIYIWMPVYNHIHVYMERAKDVQDVGGKEEKPWRGGGNPHENE